jgi:hypothetical protein
MFSYALLFTLSLPAVSLANSVGNLAKTKQIQLKQFFAYQMAPLIW